jgi:predicted nucleotidyltransferase
VSASRSLLETIAEILQRHRVEFIVIGGQAETLMGSPRVTYDVDLCYRRNPENLERLAAALREIGVTLRGAPKDLPFKVDARSLANGSNFTFDTPFGALDLLGHVEPIGGFEEIAASAETYPAEGMSLRTISLDDLIRVKQHIARFKDSESLYQLLAIKRVRGEQAGPGGAP